MLFSLNASSIFADWNSSEYIQKYKGRVGQWVNISSRQDLSNILVKVGSQHSDFTRINGTNFIYGTFLFVPYSDLYINEFKISEMLQIKFSVKEDEFICPLLSANRISSSFGIRNGCLHPGVDIPAVRGTPIVAAMDGKVVSAAYIAGHGNSVFIEHRNNYYTRYSHASIMIVKPGDYVKKGQVIAFVGTTGNSTGNHLHFEIRYNDIPLNPFDFFPVKNIEVIKNLK
jgi:murein DD-endopeptidase MepM/ murein hydrolase activator NlpD